VKTKEIQLHEFFQATAATNLSWWNFVRSNRWYVNMRPFFLRKFKTWRFTVATVRENWFRAKKSVWKLISLTNVWIDFVRDTQQTPKLTKWDFKKRLWKKTSSLLYHLANLCFVSVVRLLLRQIFSHIRSSFPTQPNLTQPQRTVLSLKNVPSQTALLSLFEPKA